ncbi:MAG: tetratricopeptide repeat protein [Candidatus Thiodiazotropha sp.]
MSRPKGILTSEDDIEGFTPAKPLPLVSGPAPLPSQAYSATGSKIPYVATPNPYLMDQTLIPTEAKAAFIVANSLLRKGELTSARERFIEITKEFPFLSGPWVKIGAIAEADNNFRSAAMMYAKAIDVNHKNINAYISLALAQRNQGLFDEAENTYLSALSIWKDFPEAHLDLAILYDLYKNAPIKAQKHYEAFYFLTGKRDEKVRKWLVEVRHRSGVNESFIEMPPKLVEKMASNKKSGDSTGAEKKDVK